MRKPTPTSALRDAMTCAHIGTDEAGKGDYFGYLVVAGAYIEPARGDDLRALGVRDSKRISDSVVRRLARELCEQLPHEIVRISPRRYNQLYAQFGNLNLLLAWAHARVIENLLERVPASLVVSDQFGDEQRLRQALMQRGRQVTLVQAPRAEQDLPVAAASIIARATFLETLEELSQRAGVPLPKGATHVLDAAGEVYRRGGRELLGDVAKLHFRTTRQVIPEGRTSG